MKTLQRCGQDGCVEWVEHDGPELPVVFCSPEHCRAWERSVRRPELTSKHRCQWCWGTLGEPHEPGCPVVRVQAP